MRKVAIPNTDVKFWTWKYELPQGNYLRSLMKPTITIQRPFELKDIDYYQIKYELKVWNVYSATLLMEGTL